MVETGNRQKSIKEIFEKTDKTGGERYLLLDIGGTVHCSGKNTMVLEISATPYIFTFKLWDWGRLGMDGLPRPIHLDHGMKNIQWNRDTKWVYDNIVGQQKTLEKTADCEIERTGLHSREFIDTIRYTLSAPRTVSMDEENIFLPLSLNFDNSNLSLRKGKEAFRPGIDQIPGTCMEYYMSDDGIAYTSPEGGALIATHDTPLVYMGEMKHHPIMLCDGKEENNQRPVYSWIMNNKWETNFKMDLSGFGEYRYSLWLSSESDPEKAMDELKEKTFDPYMMIVE